MKVFSFKTTFRSQLRSWLTRPLDPTQLKLVPVYSFTNISRHYLLWHKQVFIATGLRFYVIVDLLGDPHETAVPLDQTVTSANKETLQF